VAFAVTTVALAPVGFMSMFSVFHAYDDEGYFLVTLRDYIGGHAAYNQIYGPFFYEVMDKSCRRHRSPYVDAQPLARSGRTVPYVSRAFGLDG
jgi:hypothetical protein